MEVLRYIKQLTVIKIMNARTYALFMIQGFILYIYLKPVINFSQTVQHKVSVWVFPFLLSNIYFAFLFLLEIIYYFSNVPFMQYSNMYQIIRTGRKTWAVGQIISIFLQSVLIMAVNFLFCIILLGRNCEWGTGWGKVLHTAALTNAAQYYEFLFEIPYDAMQNFTAIELSICTFLIGSLVVFWMGIFMFMLSIVFNRMIAIIGSVSMAAGIYLVESVHPMLSQKVSMFIPTSWLRVAYVGIKEHDSFVLPSVPYIFIVLIMSIIIMCRIILRRVHGIEFEWSKEDGV
ncbi:MAG TPA: hypothetical protein DCZ40_14230 [Lachnospiraceae bacterium]|nr:hypothetical protein [Lachnospiraceae bacterium]